MSTIFVGCAADMVWDSKLCKCVPLEGFVEPVGDSKCPDGFVWNSDQQKCIPLTGPVAIPIKPLEKPEQEVVTTEPDILVTLRRVFPPGIFKPPKETPPGLGRLAQIRLADIPKEVWWVGGVVLGFLIIK